MITTILKEKLGDRMFSIANTYIISLEKGVDCAFYDKYSYCIQDEPNFNYSCNIFSKLNFNYNIYTNEKMKYSEKYLLCYQNDDIWDNKTFYNTMKNDQLIYRYDDYDRFMKNIQKDNLTPIIYSEILNYKDNFILKELSYDNKIIHNHQKELYDLFVNEQVLNEVTEKYNSIIKNSIAVSVIRKEFMTSLSEWIKDIDFYQNGINEIERNRKIDNILIFTDDINWCKENFIQDDRIIYIENEQDYIQLYLMILCEHFVFTISNLAKWGCFLSKNENKYVVCYYKI